MVKSGEVKRRKAGTLEYPRSFMLYGPPKRGKTTFACSIIEVVKPKFKKVLLLDIDLGASAIGAEFPDVDVDEFKYGDIKAFEKRWARLMEADGEGFDAIIVDTMTMLQGWKVASIPKGSGGAAYDKWDTVKDFTLGIMRDLHQMPPVGIATFHTELANMMRGVKKNDKNEVVDREYVRMAPALQGAAKMSIGAIPDIIGFADVETDEEGDLQYIVQLQPTDMHITGNRFRKLPPAMVADGGMPRLYHFIKNGTES